MAREHRYKKRKIRRRTFKDELQYIIIITIICAIVAFSLAFFTGRVPFFIDNAVQRSIEQKLPDSLKSTEKEIIKKVGKENIDDLIEKYKEKTKGSR